MSTSLETQPRRERSALYIAAMAILVVMAVVALFAFRSIRTTQEAEQKADELIAALQDAGATRVPSQDQVVRVLGEDGGAVCEDPNEALSQAILYSMLTNGAAGPGARPVIADSRAVQGELLVIETYCPEHLEDFQQLVADLELDDDVAGD
jgi:Tfp pilus assembly protein FimT